MSGAASSASTALSTARPKPSRRSALDRFARGRAAFARDLHEHRRQPCRVQRAPVRPTRSGNARCASCPSALGAPGSPPTLLHDRAGDRALQQLGRAAEAVGVGHHERLALARCRRGRRARSPRRSGRRASMRDEVHRPGVAAAAAAGRDEDDRALRLARREHARQLEQRGRPRQFGLRARAPPRRGGRRSRSALAPLEPGALRDHRRRACARRRSSAPRSGACCT